MSWAGWTSWSTTPGAFLLGPIEQLSLEEFEQTIAVNVRAPFVASQTAVRHMSAGGRIINIGSNMAERAIFPGFSLYAMSKTALTGLTKAGGTFTNGKLVERGQRNSHAATAAA